MKIGITGAFSYSGKYITRELLNRGHQVTTLTNHPGEIGLFSQPIAIHPLKFSDQKSLVKNLRGLDVFINTYWVRFNHKKFNHQQAVENTKILFNACQKAGVKRIIHVSITNPCINSDLSYFKGKSELETYLSSLNIPHSIIRPAVLFGHEDILINNIAWGLRHLPIFGLFGKGDYQLQPIHVDDFTTLIADQCTQNSCNIIDAIGPETYQFNELVAMIKKAIKARSKIMALPSRLAWAITTIAGLFLRDVIITWDEVLGLQENRLHTNSKPQGKIKLSEWALENNASIGKTYHNELSRR